MEFIMQVLLIKQIQYVSMKKLREKIQSVNGAIFYARRFS